MRNSRVGNIEIPIRVIDDEPWLARCIMSRVIVVRAELLYVTKAVSCTVICNEFDENPEACMAPDYTILVSAEEGIVFRRMSNKLFEPRFSDDFS